MKNLIISILAIITLAFTIDRIGGNCMWWVNQHTNDVSGPKIKYLADSINESVIFMGTSRCNSHYVPTIISDSIGMSCYNGGVDASDCIYAHYLVLNLILQHHTPNVICLEVMTSDYTTPKGHNPTETVSFFAPYFGRNQSADSIFMLAGTYYKYMISHLYRYNAKAVSNIAGLLYSRQNGSINGYLPGPPPPIFPDKLDNAKTPSTVDSCKLEYVKKFINICHSHNIKLIFVVSPRYSLVEIDYYNPLKQLANEMNIPFLDYHTKGLFTDHPEYFKDSGHLWDKGARLYSAIFASDLKKILSE